MMSSARTFDVIIAGAGSVGTPTAMYLAQAGFSVLVIEALPSCGQASNKHAIGGVRATHSWLLYTTDAADARTSCDFGGGRGNLKKKNNYTNERVDTSA